MVDLFNLDRSQKAARKEQLTLFEGFMDVISAFGAGFRSGIAWMGTSFTDEQATNYHTTICYDGNAAGQGHQLVLTMLAASRLTWRVVQFTVMDRMSTSK
ncbi:toprim domain-containing protein [Limosilactobacillus fermentum]